jgi:hypothetical protein
MVIESVQCADDPAQTYTLYLPSQYSTDRTWNLLLAFHPAARGRLMVEWMELQAMQAGSRSRLVTRLFEKRHSAIATSTDPAETVYLLRALVSDFKGLRDVAADVSRLDEMSKQSDVKKALKRERDADDAESRMLGEIFDLEARLNDDERRDVALMTLHDRLGRLSRKAAAETNTPERSQARRVLRSITAGAAGRVQDREYNKLLEQYRLPGR